MADPAQSNLQPGDRIAHYVLLRHLGRGAYAEVWEARRHASTDGPVAIKIPIGAESIRALAREAELPQIDHPNVVPILGRSPPFADTPYVFMKFMPGGNLASLLARSAEGLPPARVLEIIADVLSGLAEAHRRGIVHRDVKPQNILLDESGRACVADFGLSFSTMCGNASASMLQSASYLADEGRLIAGTPAYMAPEAASRPPLITPAADVYSVGIMLFELLIGRRPVGPELPTYLKRTLERGAFWDALYYWACRPLEERYAHAGAMLEALRAGPQPAPFLSARREPVAPPEPAPPSQNTWDDLVTRWVEYQQADQLLRRQQDATRSALATRSETHAEIRTARADETALLEALHRARRLLSDQCDKLLERNELQADALRGRRAALESEGLLATHPTVREVDRRLNEHAALRSMLEAVRDRQEENGLTLCMEHWRQAREANVAEGYEYFLQTFGEGLLNPWAAEARLTESLLSERAGGVLDRVSRWLQGDGDRPAES